jgi:hypothetical protein
VLHRTLPCIVPLCGDGKKKNVELHELDLHELELAVKWEAKAYL